MLSQAVRFGLFDLSVRDQLFQCGVILVFLLVVFVCPLILGWTVYVIAQSWVRATTLRRIDRRTLIACVAILAVYLYTDFWAYAVGPMPR